MGQVVAREPQEHPKCKQHTQWYGEVVRSRERNGPGVFRLWYGDVMKHEWPVITGGSIVDPEEYGGLTPPIDWVMVEPIAYRRHPRGHKLEMARIVPVDYKKSLYPKRTYDIGQDPFMIHVAGRSSGCIAIDPAAWREAVAAINEAFAENAFLIGVFEEEL